MPDAYTIILAPNPSIMTGPGTNTIILGSGSEGVTVIDPADDNAAHLDAIVSAGAERGGIRRILITHGHPDHIGGAAALRERLNAPIYAYNRQGTPLADVEVPDETPFPTGDDTLRAIHTPGHRFDHHCYLLEGARILFAGDLIAGVGTVVISPPEGDMLDYLSSLKRLQAMDIAAIVPAHGPVITEPQAKLAEYIAHRLEREQQVLHALEAVPGGASIPALVERIYVDVDPRLHPIAARSVLAHLLKLEREGRVRRQGQEEWVLV
ncbi:MAG TPA: MBL fold metallo-hydrolase [Ktedonobacteraceae bacterium]|jgi:glyoxylase-like metal-dependent hydrolase (beta-lactamase superfamily II)|nr:MBL fold metallo-hydrolase [Ktedonobacteraceae bacterium]